MPNYKPFDISYSQNIGYSCESCGVDDSRIRIAQVQIPTRATTMYVCANCLNIMNDYAHVGINYKSPTGGWNLKLIDMDNWKDTTAVGGGAFNPKRITMAHFEAMDQEIAEVKDLMGKKQIIIKALRRALAHYEEFRKAFKELMSNT